MTETRRRGAALEEAILDAAAEELRASGYPGLTMDKVARRAGTNKNAIYRRWPHRAALGLAAYKRLVTEAAPPDTGSLAADALELLRAAARHWSSPYGEILRGVLAEAPELLEQVKGRSDDGAGMWLTVLARAVARGEARPEALHPRVATVPIALLRNEFLARGSAEVPDEVLTEIIELVYLPLVGTAR